MSQPIFVSLAKPQFDPFKNFWCSFIHTNVIAASNGEVAAICWFHSDMWDKVSGFLFEPEVIRQIENRALSGVPVDPKGIPRNWVSDTTKARVSL